jgi:hypothetical protein
MTHPGEITRQAIRTPRTAAVAGIAFSGLLHDRAGARPPRAAERSGRRPGLAHRRIQARRGSPRLQRWPPGARSRECDPLSAIEQTVINEVAAAASSDDDVYVNESAQDQPSGEAA